MFIKRILQMPYSLYRELIALTEEFEQVCPADKVNVETFSNWLSSRVSTIKTAGKFEEIDWEGKINGRSAESVINTSLVHLYKYAKIYSKIAIADSPFTTIEDVIFLINLLHRGSMSKKKLIEINIQEKSTGMQIINRLIGSGFVSETVDKKDKRSKQITISAKGKEALETHMDKIREASRIVVGNLTDSEKLQLIKLLQKLEDFHKMRLKELAG